MKRKPTYGHQESTSKTGEGVSDGLYCGHSIDPGDIRELRLIDPLIKELQQRREGILSKYDFQSDTSSSAPASVSCIVIRPGKFSEEQVTRFITFVYEENICRGLTTLRLAIEKLYPRFSDEARFLRMEQITSNVPTATLVKIFDFLFDRYAITCDLIEILPQHFLSNTGEPLNISTIKKKHWRGTQISVSTRSIPKRQTGSYLLLTEFSVSPNMETTQETIDLEKVKAGNNFGSVKLTVMKAQQHPLQIFDDNLAYFQSLVSVQSDPSRFNALAAPIEERIGIVMQYIRNNGENVSRKDLDFAFTLLRKYIALWQLYFKNHPWQPLNGK